jgi:hypothetical protein
MKAHMMKNILAIATLSICTLAVAVPSQAQHRGGGGSAGRSTGGGGAVPRSSGPAVAGPRGGSPGIRGGGGYYGRPYYGSRFGIGFYGGYPYYSPYYYPYGYGYYGSVYGYPGYPPYDYGYGNYVVAGGGGERAYGSVRITDAPKDAPVYADGYYAGTVDDFDGAFQHLNLEAGTHHIEIREQGQPPLAIDVNVRPGETITFHAK